jgi:hypothetical protein
MKKLLLVLNPEKKWARVLRREVVVGVLTFVAVLLNAYLEVAPALLVPVATAVLVALDKGIREYTKKE